MYSAKLVTHMWWWDLGMELLSVFRANSAVRVAVIARASEPLFSGLYVIKQPFHGIKRDQNHVLRKKVGPKGAHTDCLMNAQYCCRCIGGIQHFSSYITTYIIITIPVCVATHQCNSY